ncbi:MAG: hypothetical protein MI864_14325, partial [Pseudomonadales bacterium]|nr:hypothetical protein [Pseudomonadales bacterium]
MIKSVSDAPSIDLYFNTGLSDISAAPTEPGAKADAQGSGYWQWLAEDERNRFFRFRNPVARQLFLTTRIMLRGALSEIVSEKPDSLRFAKGEHGKPFLIDYQTVKFNLSHTGNQAVLAVSIAPEIESLGVDIEDARRSRGSLKLARRFFA